MLTEFWGITGLGADVEWLNLHGEIRGLSRRPVEQRQQQLVAPHTTSFHISSQV